MPSLMARLRNIVIIISKADRRLWFGNWGSWRPSVSPMSSTAPGADSHVKAHLCSTHFFSVYLGTFVYNIVYRQTGLIFHLCVKPTTVCILCAHWADHKILVSGDWPDRKRLVNRDCPSEGCDRRPGTTPHQRPCRDLLKRYSNLLKQYSNDLNSFFSALHWLEAVTK